MDWSQHCQKLFIHHTQFYTLLLKPTSHRLIMVTSEKIFRSILFLSIILGVLIHFFRCQSIYPIVAYFIILKYFVHYPKIFTTMLAFKYLIPLSYNFMSIGDLRFSHRGYVCSTELYSSRNLSFGDLIEFNSNSYASR